jgi:FKBP-type peptidyl-prolyl cis-trans isomerase (trigger factor)
MIEDEVRRFKDGMKGLEEYLASIDSTMEAHREELKPVAEKRIVRSLVLTEIAEKDEVKVEEKDIDEEIEKMVKDAGEQEENMRIFFNQPQSRQSIGQYMMGKKTIDRLAEIAGGEEKSE